jgi:hypothetical protein
MLLDPLGGGGGVDTVTVTVDVLFPPGPVATRSYDAVFVGDTLRDPLFGTGALSKLTLVALTVCHDSTDDCPS